MARTKPLEVSDELWQRAEPVLPPAKPRPRGGCPPRDDRQMLGAILYVLRTGLQWNALPREIGDSTTVYDRFRVWEGRGAFERLWAAELGAFDEVVGIDWERLSMDGVMTKAPFGRAATAEAEVIGHNPTDRGKHGTKRSTLSEGHGLPVAVVVAGANVPDMKLAAPTLDAMVIVRPEPSALQPSICASTRAMTMTCRASPPSNVATSPIFARVGRTAPAPAHRIQPSSPAAGSSSDCTAGSIARGVCSSVGRSWSAPIRPFCIWPVPSSASTSVTAIARHQLLPNEVLQNLATRHSSY